MPSSVVESKNSPRWKSDCLPILLSGWVLNFAFCPNSFSEIPAFYSLLFGNWTDSTADKIQWRAQDRQTEWTGWPIIALQATLSIPSVSLSLSLSLSFNFFIPKANSTKRLILWILDLEPFSCVLIPRSSSRNVDPLSTGMPSYSDRIIMHVLHSCQHDCQWIWKDRLSFRLVFFFTKIFSVPEWIGGRLPRNRCRF